MKQPPKTKVKSAGDTTKIPTPYKMYNPVGVKPQNYRSSGDQDSTRKKTIYNAQVDKSRVKRNLEINSSNKKSGSSKKPIITRGDVFGNDTKLGAVFSTKGKTYKEAPLKIVKKK